MTFSSKSHAFLLLENFDTFHQSLISFITSCSDLLWQQHTLLEGWPVAATAHHIGTAHYERITWVQLIAKGQTPPQITLEDINRINAENARKNAHFSKTEVISFLQSKADTVVKIMNELTDKQLARKAYLQVIGGEISANQFFSAVVVEAANSHLASMKAVGQ